MSLPLYQTASKELMLLQTNWALKLNPVIDLPMNSGNFLKSISLVSGSNQINHLLSRKLQGWFLVRKRASADIYDTQDSNTTPSITLSLVSDATVSVDIFVF